MNQNDPTEEETERAVRMAATHVPVVRAKADGRWERSTENQMVTLSLYSKSREVALFTSNVEDEKLKRDGAVIQMRWSLDLIYAVWITDESRQQPGNACFNIVLADSPVVKSRMYSGKKMWQVVHAAPPSKLCSMSSTHAYLCAEIKRTEAEVFVTELRKHYCADSNNHGHIILFEKPPTRSGWKKYNDPILLSIRVKHYERASESLTTALGLWLQKWSKLKGEARKRFELDPWFVHDAYTTHVNLSHPCARRFVALCDKGEAIIEDYIRLVRFMTHSNT